MLENAAHRLIVATADLLQDNVAHLVHLILWKGGGQQKFMYEIERRIEFGVDDLCPDLCALPPSAGTLARSQCLECLVQCACILLFCTLKEHVFEEVGQSFLVFRLVY